MERQQAKKLDVVIRAGLFTCDGAVLHKINQ